MRVFKFFFLFLFGIVFLITLLKVFFFVAFFGLFLGSVLFLSGAFRRRRMSRYAFQRSRYVQAIPLDPRYSRPFGPVSTGMGTPGGTSIEVL